MRYFYWGFVPLGVICLLLLIGVLLVKLRKYWAKNKVQRSSYEEKCRNLNQALESFGFCYEEKGDLISSGLYGWQREVGYCKAYDEGAAAMYMIFDREPVYFDYRGKHYLIELWKGQYGCAAGAEIGVYVNQSEDREKLPEDLFYECVTDEERLQMRFVLYENGVRLLERNALHWWLTGFCPGKYVKREDLRMEVMVTFPSAGMCRAFYYGLLRVGYKAYQIHVEGYRVYFVFDRPLSRQSSMIGKWHRKLIMRRNRKNCRLYCRVTKEFTSTLDKITYIGYCFPFLYRSVLCAGRMSNKRKYYKYRKKMKR